MKKIAAVILLLGCLLVNFAACKNGSTTPSSGTDTKPSTENQDPFSDVDLGKEEITLLCMKESGAGGSQIDSYNELFAEQNGDVINDAIFLRYAAMQDSLNCVLNIRSVGDKSTLGTILRDYNMSGESANISAALLVGKSLPAVISTGDLVDLNSVSSVDLSNDWWIRSGVSDMTIAGKCYAAPGNASVYGLTSMACVYFNKDVMSDNRVEENLYDTVRNYQWTLEKMAKLSADLTAELDGNEGISISDRVGFVAEYGYLSYMFTSTGGRTVEIGSDKKVTMTVGGQATSDFIDAFLTLFNNNEVTKVPVRDYDDDYTEVAKHFMNQQVVFYAHYVFDALDLRGMEGEFGLLPTPMANEDQHAYYAGVNRWLSSYTVIPSGCVDIEKAGIIAEALNYYGKQYIREAIYTKSFESGRSVRDEDSIEMFNLIVEAQVHDPGLLLTDTVYSLFSSVASLGTNTFASSIKKREQAFVLEMESIIK